MRFTHHRPTQRGSLLIVALILCAVIGISLVSYLNLGRTSLAISNRALYNNAAINLAENGLEEAMYAVNQMVADSTYAWPSWTNNGTGPTSDAWRSWTGTTFDQNATGMVRVYVYNYKGLSAPKVIARSTITLGGASSAPIEKWIEVTLRRTSKFSNGLVAKTSVTFNGTNTSVDSWNSDPDNNSATAAVAYSTTAPGVRRDNGSVGSISVGVNAVLVKQADIWGFVSTGGADPTSTVGAGGSILGSGSVYNPATWTSANVDPSRVATDFAASFDAVTAPAKTYIDLSGQINSSLTLPRAADVAAHLADADGNYYYTATKVNLTNDVLTASGKVVLKLTYSGGTSVDIGGGSGAISVGAGASLAIYTDGDIKIAGNGVANGVDASGNGSLNDAEAGQPINFQIWGTKTSGTQDIKVAGNGTFSGVIYAPQGDVSVNGNGSVSGSIVADKITMVGNAAFHFDESLANFGGGNPFRISKWKELTSSDDRNTYSSVMSW